MKPPLFPARLLLALAWLNALPSLADLTWDPNGTTTGIVNGSGTWNTANNLWWDGSTNVSWVNSASAVAIFGGGAAVAGPTVSVAENITLGSMIFRGFTAAPASGQQYTLQGNVAGRILDFGESGTIQFEDLSSGGSQFVNLGSNLLLKGNNLRFQKYGPGTAVQFVNLSMLNNPDLTGSFTLGGSIYAGIPVPGALGAASGLVVEAGGTANLSGLGANYTLPISIAGFGAGLLNNGTPYGAIRIGNNNINLSGGIILTGNGGIHTNYSTSALTGYTGTVISAPITDGGNNFEFHRFALGKGNGTLSLAAANTYGGTTVLGRATAGFSGAITILDFAATTSPQNDILYHGLATPGGLTLIGGNHAPSILRVTGKDGVVNNQRLGNVTVSGTHSTVELTSGSGGSVNLSVGSFSRSQANSTLTLQAPVSGTVTTTQTEGLIGPWMTFVDATGTRSWGQVTGGLIQAGYSGDSFFVTGGSLSDPTFTSQSNVGITSASGGDVSQAAGVLNLATLSMADSWADRNVPVGAGNTLRLGVTGGIQVVSGARGLTVGEAGITSSLSAGGTVTNTAGQIILSNHSSQSLLTVHSNIVNNGTGAVLVINQGAPGSRTLLLGTNTHTGGTLVSSGILEVRSNGALGTTGTVSVLDGATLGLAEGMTLNRALASIAGLGDQGKGAIRNMSGNNIISGLITQTAPALLTADAGSQLTIQLATPATNAIAGSYGLTFGGEGTIAVNSRIAIGALPLIKNDSGRLILGGDNTYTGITSIYGGSVEVTHSNGLGTAAGLTTVYTGASLELSNGISLAEPITLASTGVANAGGLRNKAGDNTLTGLLTLGTTTMRIASDAGTLIFDTASGPAILHNSSSSRTLVFSGAGDFRVLDPMTRSSTGLYAVSKEGAGTLTFGAQVNNTATTVNGGTMHLDFSLAGTTSSNLLFSAAPGTLTLGGGTLKISGRSGASVSQTIGNVTLSNYSSLQILQNGASNLDVTLGTVTRNWFSIWGIDLPTVGSLRMEGGADNQALMSDGRAYAFIRDAVNGDEWAATGLLTGAHRQVVRLSAIGGYTPSTLGSLSGHADISAGTGTTSLPASTSVSSLRFAQAQDTLITQDTTGVVLDVGGILVSSTVGAHSSTISTSTLRPAASTANNPELVIIQNNVLGPLIINSAIVNRTESGRTTVSVVKAGPGLVVMNGNNTYSGNLRVNEGAVQLAGGAVSGSMEFLLGYGAGSGKIILGAGSTAFHPSLEYIEAVGTGTDNRIVGGASSVSILTLSGTSTQGTNFTLGYLGGPGANENNLALSLNRSNSLVRLGGGSTYNGKTIFRAGTVEVSQLSLAGQASSFGQGNLDPVIEMGSSSSSGSITATLRYVGTEDSYTDRAINLASSNATATSVTAVIENNGTGFLQFLSPFTSSGTNVAAQRTLVLTGSNEGDNRIVGIGNNGTAATALEKRGTGTWSVTGGSLFSGGVTVNEGRLLVMNISGSGTGLGDVTANFGTVLGGSGIIAPAADKLVTIDYAKLEIGHVPAGMPAAGSALTIQTLGEGMLLIGSGSELLFDLYSGAGSGDNTAIATAADRLIVGGMVAMGEDVTLRLSNLENIGGWAVNDQWQLFDWSGLTAPVIGGIDHYDLPDLPGGLMWNTSELFTTGVLSISFVPEPSRIVLLLVGGLACLGRRKRQLTGNTEL